MRGQEWYYSLQKLKLTSSFCLHHKSGKEIYSKVAGFDSVAPDAQPLREDAVFKLASATKLIVSIALLQCIDSDLVGLDEPLSKILPELDGKEILLGESETGFIFESSKIKIAPRHLLSHTSGLAYPFLHPLLGKWRASPVGLEGQNSRIIAEKYNTPLLFEPGTGWVYGGSLDWAGVLVRRLNKGISLEDYMIENIWKPLGLSHPFPTFAISNHPEYKARLLQGTTRNSAGQLEPHEFWFGDNPEDQEGGAGLVATAQDYTAVLADLVSDSPKLLKLETVSLMFTPQIPTGSPCISMLHQLRPAWEHIAGPISSDVVNHGLGGLLLLGDVPEISQPKNLLVWGGASNIAWFASKELGVAGFFATQISPFGDQPVNDLINGWKKDFWSRFDTVP